MSGIAGLYRLDGRPVEAGDIQRMTDGLAHRGPDGGDVWFGGGTGLGHRMLWTTPESLAEHQPVRDLSGKLVLTADARIDNREELSRKLGRVDRPDVSDSELILAAYAKWGEACPEHLIGVFAFAIWDSHEQRLFCARDAVGIRPFYYFHKRGSLFAFASEVKSLFCLEDVPRRLNETKVADYLASLAEDKVITFYEDIYRLQPAHCVTITRDGARFRKYWSLDPERELKLGSPEEYAEAFREVLTEAVRCRLRSAYPLGMTLSGGLDSSSIVAIARLLQNDDDHTPLHTISCVFDDVGASDERKFIQLMTTGGDITSHFVHPDRHSALYSIEKALWHQDEPAVIRNLFLWTLMYEKAQEEGIRVVLDGEDGDTVVSKGYHYLFHLARAGRWNAFADLAESPPMQFFSCYEVPKSYWLWRFGLPELRTLARDGKWREFARAVDQVARRFNVSRQRLVLDYGIKPIAPPIARRLWHWFRGTNGAHHEPSTGIGGLIDPGFAERIGFEQRYNRFMARYSSAGSYREGHWQALTSGGPSAIMEEDDKTSAAYEVEKRHPFFDRRLMEFCLALPPELRLHEGWPRWIQRRAMEGILPPQIQWRVDKADLAHNFQRSLFDLGREQVEELSQNSGVLAPYVDVSSLEAAIRKRDGSTVWAAAVLMVWLRSSTIPCTMQE